MTTAKTSEYHKTIISSPKGLITAEYDSQDGKVVITYDRAKALKVSHYYSFNDHLTIPLAGIPSFIDVLQRLLDKEGE